MVQQNEDTVGRASQAQLMLDIGDTQFEFVSSLSYDRIRGRTYHSVFIDDTVEMTADQMEMIMSRKSSHE
jgi:predicted ribonuclease YlaK